MTTKEAVVSALPLFAKCSKQEIELIAKRAEEIDIDAGRDLMREGETGKEFFVIRSGTAEVRRGGQVIAELGPGDFVGEMALVEETRRTATVTATSPMDVFVITTGAFRTLCERLPGVADRVNAAIRARHDANAAL